MPKQVGQAERLGEHGGGAGRADTVAIFAAGKIARAPQPAPATVHSPHGANSSSSSPRHSEPSKITKLALFKRGVHALPIYGGQSYDRQLFGLRQGAHIVIGTPGRVMDHMRRGTLKLDAVKMAVLDEVDVMLNMGFRDDIELILQATPATRQTVFFSATIPRPIQQLIEKYARDPQQVRIEQKALTVPTVEQVYYEVDRRYKVDLLMRLIDIHDLKLGIIFCNTKRMVDDLVDHLNAQGYSADRLHGDMTQMMRDRVMQKFRKSGLEFLVATDVAARGIDVDDVEVVFNYDLPYDGEDYVHRIGRTGRMGHSGRAISFASGREVFAIRNIERYTNVRIQRARPPTADEVEEARTNVFADKLRATLKSGEFKRHDQLIECLLEEGFASTDIISALINQLQGGDDAPAKPVPRLIEPPRPGRAGHAVAAVYDRRITPPKPQLRPAPREAPPVAPPAVSKPPVSAAPAPLPMNLVEASSPRPSPPQVCGGEGEEARSGSRAQGALSGRGGPSPAAAGAAPKAAPRTASKPAVEAAVPKPASKPLLPVPIPRPSAHSADATCSVAPAAQSAIRNPQSATESHGSTESRPTGQSAIPNPQSAIRNPQSPVAAARQPVQPRPAFQPKTKRVTQPFQTRLWMNVGEENGVLPIDIVNTIAGETGLPGNVVGTVDIRGRHLFADVAAEHANAIIAKLNRTQIKGHKLKVKAA